MIDSALLSPGARDALTSAGWTTGRELDQSTLATWRLRYTAAHDGVADDGTGAEPTPCWNAHADEVLLSLGGLAIVQSGAGVDLARNSFELNPLLLLHWTRTLAIRGQALGTVLAPLGKVENNAAIAVSSEGAIHLIDHTGEWVFEAGLERGLSDLIDGVAPATRLAL